MLTGYDLVVVIGAEVFRYYPWDPAAQPGALSVGRSQHAFARLYPDRLLDCRGDGVDVDEEVAGTAQGRIGPVGWRVAD